MKKAVEYVNSGEFLWNSGIFAWKVSTILSKLRVYTPEMFGHLAVIRNAIGTSEENFVLAMIVVDSEDALLICRKNDAGKIRDLTKLMKDSGRNEL